jgi:hypothetical protein
MVSKAPETDSQMQKAGDEFHMMMGYCISQWAHIDELLFQIFQSCVGPIKQCAIIYYRQPGIEIRQGLVDEIVLATLPAHKSGKHPHSALKAWKKFKSEWSDLISVRRRIAHHGVWIRSGTMNVTLGTQTLGTIPVPTSFALYANHHERMRGRKSDQDVLTIKELKKHYKDMKALREQIHNFIYGHLKPYLLESSRQSPQQESDS